MLGSQTERRYAKRSSRKATRNHQERRRTPRTTGLGRVKEDDLRKKGNEILMITQNIP